MCRTACHVHVRAGVERGLPPPARVHALVHLLERARNRGAGSGRRPCEWATVLWSAAPLFFFRRSECKPRRAREYRAEEKRKSNNRREKWARFESGYETEHRRITVEEILSAVNQISREMRALETDPVLDNSPYGKSGRSDGQSRTDSVVSERIVCG